MPLFATIGIAAFWLIAFVVGQLAWTQLARNPRYSRILSISFSASVAAFFLTMVLANCLLLHAPPLAWIASVAAGLLLMACAFILYTPFVFVVSSSLSVDTIIMLSRNGSAMSKDEVYDQFVSIDAVDHRLSMMQTNGLLTSESGRYFLTPKALRVTRFFTAMKHLWKLWPGG
jgi:hypothetical protein